MFVYGMVFYTCWLITEHYKEYITLRQAYVVRSTEIPSNALGGSTGAIDAESQPLLAVRSPLKKKHMLARSSSFDPIGGVRRGKTGSLKLPRRDASASGTADGLTAGVEMITLCMGNGTSNGSRPMEGGNGAGSGGMDAAGPSRLVPQPSRLSAAPFGNTTSTVTGTSSQALPPGADVELGRVRHVRAPSGSGSDGAVVVMDGSGTDGTAFRGPRHGRGKSSGSGSGGMGGQFPHKPVHGSADWTVHDFSNEVLPQNPLPPIGTTPHGAVTDAEEVATPMRTTSALPRGQSGVMPSMPPLWSPPQPGGLRRVPSNAAVAAALDPTARTTSGRSELLNL